MVDVLAVCNSCGALFSNPNLIGGTGGRVTFKNSTMGPCPTCGGVGDIFDGIYDLATNTAKLLISEATKPEQLQHLGQILKSAKRDKLSHNQIGERLEKELPELQSLKDSLPKTRMELYAFIGVILTFLALISTVAFNLTKEEMPITEEKITKYIDQSISEQTQSKEPQSKKKEKIGRNESCPCGSGKKYKKCCLLAI